MQTWRAKTKDSLALLWQALREFSGEAALERRLQHSCHCQKDAIKEAWEERFGGIHRCC
jgi:hypothetical protein